MIDFQSILIPEQILAQHHSEATAKASHLITSSDCALVNRSYLNYLVVTYGPEYLPPEWQSETLILYNRYFWFLQFTKRQCELKGDAGLEQQAFQILECPTAEIDWKVIEAIEEETQAEGRRTMKPPSIGQ